MGFVQRVIHHQRPTSNSRHILIFGMFFTHTALFVFSVWIPTVLRSRFPVNPQGAPHWHVSPIPWVDGMVRFDSSFYLKIAWHGYSTTDLSAFFPLYPLITRVAGDVISWIHGPFSTWGDFPAEFTIAGLVISNLSFLGILYLLYVLTSGVYSEAVATRTVIYLALFPTSFFFSTIYTEALFLFLVCLAFYFGRREQWFVAGIIAGLAALTRNIGFIVAFSLIVMLLKSHRVHRPKRWRAVAQLLFVTLLPAVVFAVYPAFLMIHFHNPLMFLAAQKNWGRHFVIPWSWFWKALTNYPMDFLCAFIFTLITILSWRALKSEHWVYLLIGLLIPLSSVSDGDPQSMLRLVIVLFPGFIWMGMVLKHKYAVMLYLTISIVILIEFTALFSTWVFVA